MENFSLFIKVYLAEIIMSVIAVAASIVILYLLKNKPEKLGFKEKPSAKMYLFALVPFVLVAWSFFQNTTSGLSYPTGVAIHLNTIVVDGIIETIRENTTNGDTYVETHSKTFLFDKTTGKEIANLSGFTPRYCAGTMMLGIANFGYNIVDLNTGKVLKVISDDDIKARAGDFAGEKIYSVELKKGETSFAIRSVKDKNFVYDPILEKATSSETHTPFYSGEYRNEKFSSKKVDLFLAEELGKTKDGTTLVLSYDDLEKKAFLISAISPGGELLWTMRDYEISPELEGQLFTIEATEKNTVLDDQNFYFVNNAYLVCASLANGQLKWMIPL
jgi:hypothetical protein